MSILSPLLNSVSISGTVATLNCTPPVDIQYSFSQIIYRKFGSSSFIMGSIFFGTQGVSENQTQSGLIEGQLYQFGLLSADISSRYSFPSQMLSAVSTTSIAESNLFITNAMTIIANSATFQSWTKSNNSNEAILRIYDREFNNIIEEKNFPLATLYYAGGVKSNRIDSNLFLTNTSIQVQFIETCSGEHDRDEAKICRDHLSVVEKIIFEIKRLQGVDSYLIIKSIDLNGEPQFMMTTEEETDLTEDFIFSQYTLEAGA